MDIKAGKGWDERNGKRTNFKEHYAFQVLFCHDLVTRIQGTPPRLCRIVKGDGEFEEFDRTDFQVSYAAALAEVRRLVAEEETSEPVLRMLFEGVAPAIALNSLIALASTLALRRLHGRINAAARAAGASPSDMATSAVAGLFSPGDGEAPIVTALAEYLDLDDTGLFLRFQAVVIGAASQKLFPRWHENDSLSARLLRNLQRALRHDEQLATIPAGRPEWLCLADSRGFRTDKPSIGYSDLEAIVRALQTPSGFNADMIVKLLQEVGKLEHFNKIVSIELLFSVLRDQTRELVAAEMRTGGQAGITHRRRVLPGRRRLPRRMGACDRAGC